MTASELEAELHKLLGMVHRLSPLDQHPDRFYEQKSALAGFVGNLIERVGGHPKSPRSYAAGHTDSGVSSVHHNGRIIPIERRPLSVRTRI